MLLDQASLRSLRGQGNVPCRKSRPHDAPLLRKPDAEGAGGALRETTRERA